MTQESDLERFKGCHQYKTMVTEESIQKNMELKSKFAQNFVTSNKESIHMQTNSEVTSQNYGSINNLTAIKQENNLNKSPFRNVNM